MNRLELLEDRLKAECADQNGGPEALDAALKQLPLLQLLLARAVKANKKPDVEKKEYVCWGGALGERFTSKSKRCAEQFISAECTPQLYPATNVSSPACSEILEPIAISHQWLQNAWLVIELYANIYHLRSSSLWWIINTIWDPLSRGQSEVQPYVHLIPHVLWFWLYFEGGLTYISLVRTYVRTHI